MTKLKKYAAEFSYYFFKVKTERVKESMFIKEKKIMSKIIYFYLFLMLEINFFLE